MVDFVDVLNASRGKIFYSSGHYLISKMVSVSPKYGNLAVLREFSSSICS